MYELVIGRHSVPKVSLSVIRGFRLGCPAHGKQRLSWPSKADRVGDWRRGAVENSPAEPRRMLQHGQSIPGIECNDRLQHGRQVLCLPPHAAPFLQAFVPVEIVDQRVLFQARAGPGVVARSIEASERTSTASMAANSASSGLAPSSPSSPFSFFVRTAIQLASFNRHGAVGAKQWCRPRLPAEAAETALAERPAARLHGNPPACF